MEKTVLSEIKEVKERLSVIEYLLRANLVPEDEPTRDEKKAILEFERSFRAGKEKLVPIDRLVRTGVAVSRRASKKGR